VTMPRGPPYPGQGTAIPPEMGKGQWVLKPDVFLDFEQPDPGPLPATGRIELALVVPNGLGGKALRFRAQTVASLMGITVGELAAANKIGKLSLSLWSVPPRHGDSFALRFRLSYGRRIFEVSAGVFEMPRA
jgi:hypothetical protein